MKKFLFFLMAALVLIGAISCKKTEKNDNSLLEGTQWEYMGDTRAQVEDAMIISFDVKTFTLSEYLVRSVKPDRIRQGTFVYKKPKLTMDFADGSAWNGIVSDDYIDFGDVGQFMKVK